MKFLSKKLIGMGALVTLLLAMPTGTWAGNGAGIALSPHDFSAAAWNTNNDICSVCHVPHDNNRNDTLFANGLLWNHQVSAATYRMYAEEAAASLTFANHIDGVFDNEPTGGSKLCLGCHDGTVGLNQFDANVGAAGTDWVLPASQVPGPAIPDVGAEKNLLGTHPISIVYDPAADASLAPLASAMGGSGTINDVLEPTAVGPKLQCSSCHDVHDSPGESIAATKLLRESMTAPASGLCLTCHLK